MWIEKLARGVLELDTPIGPRYLQPNFLERVLLLWTFRNFCSLPQEVLRTNERQLIDRLWNENRFVARSIADASEQPIIGRVERRAMATVEAMPKRKPPASSGAALAEEGRQAISA
ncbi:MAG TPA: hypothetical protein VMI10_07255 [Terriglobales bacterium]|nr:hypothetical protein [Terriglobales bacterium]